MTLKKRKLDTTVAEELHPKRPSKIHCISLSTTERPSVANMESKTTRRVYSADQLRRLQCTTSQPKLREAIEELDGDDAELVKEHVLRGSRSFAARSWKSRASITSRATSGKENRSTTNNSDNDRPTTARTSASLTKAIPVLGEIPPNAQLMRPPVPYKPGPSPTPSLRKKKIESLVKAHGSPDHVRVTAGGRIVPSEQSPLCHPRYGYSAVKMNGGLVKFAPCHPTGKAQWTQATQNGFVAQDINGRLCQIVDGTILPLHETEAGLQLYMPAPNLNITQRTSPVAPRQAAPAGFAGPGARQPAFNANVVPEPSLSSQINALEVEYIKLEHELKDVDKTEVLHGRTMGKGAKDALIAKRRELVINLDRIRKALKSLRDQAPTNISPPQQAHMHKQAPSSPRNRLSAFLQHRQNQSLPAQAVTAPMFGPLLPAQQPFPAPFAIHQATPSPDSAFGQPWAMPPPAMFAPPPSFDGSMSSTNLAFQPHPEPFMGGLPTHQAMQPSLPPVAEMPVDNAALPQSDGSRDSHRVGQTQSHAVPVKAEKKPATKSNLNPMSPIYKPGAGLLQEQPNSVEKKPPSAKSIKDRVPTPLSPLHQLQQSAGSLKLAKATDADTDSPTKITGAPPQHVQSSSISSSETADFFPRNTAEYSNREYAASAQQSPAEKENRDPPPVTPAKDNVLSHGHPVDVPAAPPGTPIDGLAPPDRTRHNLSPKGRNWRFIEELPADLAKQPTPSPEKLVDVRPSEPAQPTDLAGKSQAWIDGYNAGRASRESHAGSDLLSRPSSAVMSTTSLGSRLSLPPASRIFSGLFAQIDGIPQQQVLNASLVTESVHAHASPTGTPDDSRTVSPTKSPHNKTSPARQKFERIAESVGIKVAGETSPSKRRWRDVWRASKC